MKLCFSSRSEGGQLGSEEERGEGDTDPEHRTLTTTTENVEEVAMTLADLLGCDFALS